MVPRATVIVTGAVGDRSWAPKAGEAVTTGGGATVVVDRAAEGVGRSTSPKLTSRSNSPTGLRLPRWPDHCRWVRCRGRVGVDRCEHRNGGNGGALVHPADPRTISTTTGKKMDMRNKTGTPFSRPRRRRAQY